MWRNATYNAAADPSDAIISIPPKEPYLWWKPAVISLDFCVYGGLLIGATALVLGVLKTFNFAGKGKEDNE